MESDKNTTLHLPLPVHYWPSLEWLWLRYARGTESQLKLEDRFRRRGMQSRCYINGADGAIRLSIPVKDSRKSMQMRETLIENNLNWQKNHWRSIQTAYGKCAYFEHYAPEIEALYKKEWSRLQDMNLHIIEWVEAQVGKAKILVLGEEVLGKIKNQSARHEGVLMDDERLTMLKLEAGQRYRMAFRNYDKPLRTLSVLDGLMNMGPRLSDWDIRMQV